MTIKKDGEKWLVDLYPEGRGGKRVRKKFDTGAEAARFEKFVLSAVHQGKDWNTSKRDSRHLNELIDIWYKARAVISKMVHAALSASWILRSG